MILNLDQQNTVMSRLPLKVNHIPAVDLDNRFMVGQVQALPVLADEVAIRYCKKAMKASQHNSLSFDHRLSNFLFTYRCTQHATTNEPPCQLFMERTVRTRFDLLHPSDNRRVNEKQADQKAYHDRKARERSFTIGQRVVVKNQIPGKPWVPGIVEKVQGPLTYLVHLDTGQLWKRHVDHIREVGETDFQRNN